VKVKAVEDKFVPKWSMYRNGPNFDFGEKPVPKWYVPKWSCTELALTPHEYGHYQLTTAANRSFLAMY